MLEFTDSFRDLLPMMLLKIGVAVACGILLGIEREIKDKPAGLRTMVLITVGATLYMIVSGLMPLVSDAAGDVIQADPGRVAAQVVTGIGFLGAGTIIRARGSIHGLTTAAVIWVAAGIGLCIGAGFPLLALCTTLIVIFTLVMMDPLRQWLSRRAERRELRFRIPNDALVLQRARYLLEEFDVHEREVTVRTIGVRELEVAVALHADPDAAGRLMEALSTLPGVHGPAAH
ncbi:MAG TPA: MgtC/SapB family protein [Rhodothermales bacterium]